MSIGKRSWEAGGEQRTAWVVDYVDQHGKRRLKTFDLKKDAEAWATNALHEVAQGIHARDVKTTIVDIVDRGSATALTRVWNAHHRAAEAASETSHRPIHRASEIE